jgi:hypothetical protein
MRHQAADADLLFFTNTNRKKTQSTRVAFPLGQRSLWRWDPEIGTRTPYAAEQDSRGFELTLDPLESVLLVTETKTDSSRPTIGNNGAPLPALRLSGPWQAHFVPADGAAPFTLQLPDLVDFAQSTDPRLRQFSGTVTYTTDFESAGTEKARIDLGPDNDDVTAVTLNGELIGVNWYGRPSFDLTGAIQPGLNTLEIAYTTTLFNSMIGTETFDRLWRKFHRNEEAVPMPSGLVGPVRISGQGIRQKINPSIEKLPLPTAPRPPKVVAPKPTPTDAPPRPAGAKLQLLSN